jgi:hypothetical protein
MLALLFFGVLGERVCAQAPEKFATIEKKRSGAEGARAAEAGCD